MQRPLRDPRPEYDRTPLPVARATRSDADKAPVARRSLVRPYARTRGRTRPGHELAVEALVSTSARGLRQDDARSAEQRTICELCEETQSVAEIAAKAGLPLGVVKVLVGDLAEAGLVLVHQRGQVINDSSSREFMHRVLEGLRSL
jgi:hypothetical protein